MKNSERKTFPNGRKNSRGVYAKLVKASQRNVVNNVKYLARSLLKVR
jgi:hypothetical protein